MAVDTGVKAHPPKLTGPSITPDDVDQVILLLHGYGLTGESIFRRLAKPLSSAFPKSYIIAPDAPYISKDYPEGFDWIRFDGDWTPEHIIQKLCGAEVFLNSFINGLLGRFNLKEQQLVIIGFSQGARVAMHLALRCRPHCKAMIGFSGGVSQLHWLKDNIPYAFPESLSICLIHGEADDVVPIEQHREAMELLAARKIHAESYIIPKLKHRMSEEGIALCVEFLENA